MARENENENAKGHGMSARNRNRPLLLTDGFVKQDRSADVITETGS